ncbi:MAG: DUF4387 domain-containing protein [Defluviitaleaceae bacterium]|nr:DUF4387 domain-containing protein [Defluviitaleaceae bacterium]
MTRLFDISDVIRSKNSGPYELTFDIIFKDFDSYRQVVDSGFFTAENFANLYRISIDDIICIVNFAPAKAIKITVKRPICSGDLGETDVYGAQQHIPLLNLSLDI